MMRVQLPLRPAYCMTYNKSQGQTIGGRVLLDVTEQPFEHGQCYAALSRVQQSGNIALMCSNDGIFEEADSQASKLPIITNFVYKHILHHNYPDTRLTREQQAA